MQVKNIVPIVVAVTLGTIAVLLVGRYMGSQDREEAVKAYYLVAAQNLGKGDVLSQENVTARRIAETDVPGIAIPVPTRSAAVQVYGQKVMRDIERDDFILYTDLGALTISPLAEAVAPGKWAVTIGVDNISGLAGLVRPGDEVALLATMAIRQQTASSDLTDERSGGTRMVPSTFVLYPVVKVLAVGQRVAGEVSPFGKDTKGGGGEVTLLVTPQQAQKIAHVRQFGRLTLAMRRAGDSSGVDSSVFGAVTDAAVVGDLLQGAK